MKNFKTSTYIFLFAVIAIFTASCSNQRYSYIQRGHTNIAATAPKSEGKQNSPALQTQEVPQTKPEASTVINTNHLQTLPMLPSSNIATTSQNSIKSVVEKNAIGFAPISKMKSKFALSHAMQKAKSNETSVSLLFLVALLLCLIPFVGLISIGLATDWDLMKILIGAILYILGVLPGIIFAIYITVINQDKFGDTASNNKFKSASNKSYTKN